VASAPQRLSFGGLKDRHAQTLQHFTIEAGPPESLDQRGLRVTYLGQVPEPFASRHIRANRFLIVIRDLTSARAERALTALDEVRGDGLANYFDDQRFGSVEADRDFIARRMVRGEWEQALKLALAAPYEFDRAPEKKVKATLRANWGDWKACRSKLPKCHAQTLVNFLAANPSDFRGAIAGMRADMTGLYLSAYQSHLWNQFLDRWLSKNLPEEHRVAVRLKLDAVPMPRRLAVERRAELSRLMLPLPSARLHYEDAIPNAPVDWQEVLSDVLKAEQIELDQLKLHGLRRPFFSRGERAIIVHPANLRGELSPDERHAGQTKLTLEFDMPRGSYATLLVKRVTTGG